jgi:cytochrome c oxidase subunit I
VSPPHVHHRQVYLPWFSLMSFLIAVPTGIKVWNWLATMWRGSITLNAAMLNALAFIAVFVIGGITGVFVASPPIDFAVNDTYYVVAHFHYVMAMALLFALVAGAYFWFPRSPGAVWTSGSASSSSGCCSWAST